MWVRLYEEILVGSHNDCVIEKALGLKVKDDEIPLPKKTLQKA